MSEAFLKPALFERGLNLLHRFRYLLAVASFCAGLASFALIQRQDWLAKPLAVFLLLSWLLILLEGPLTRGRLTPGVLRFAVQAVHQETFFFALPFFYATTTWDTPQAAFTVLLTAVGLATLWDPLYYGRLAAHRGVYLLFHGMAIFVAMLVALPIVLRLTTSQSLALSSAAIALFAAPGLAQLMDAARPSRRLLMLAGGVGLGALAWFARPWVPPATLWIEQAMVTDAVDKQARVPGVRLASVSAAHLHTQGLFAWTAIHAPLGLHERVYHRWLLDGVEVDRIPMQIVGGRAQGYRAWSYKQGFPADPRGEWTVQVLAEGGQLIGQFRFVAVGGAEPAPLPPPPAPVNPG